MLRDECVYLRESGPEKFCFKPSSMYTAECKDTGSSTGAMVDIGGYGDNGKCSFSENMAADKQSYTINNIKTDEAGVWKFVFDKAYMTINFEIVDGGSVPITQSFFCGTMPSETWCTSDNPIPAGTYTIEVRSPSDDKWTDGTPKLLTYYVDNKDYCEGNFSQDRSKDEDTEKLRPTRKCE